MRKSSAAKLSIVVSSISFGGYSVHGHLEKVAVDVERRTCCLNDYQVQQHETITCKSPNAGSRVVLGVSPFGG